MIDVVKDLSQLTNIDNSILQELIRLAILDIGHTTLETFIEHNNQLEADLGIGILYIKYNQEGVKYKFIPSDKLETTINEALSNKVSPLVKLSDRTLKSRLEETYKYLI